MKPSRLALPLIAAACWLAQAAPASAEGRYVRLTPPPESVPEEMRQQILTAMKLYANKDHEVRLKAVEDFSKVADPVIGRYLLSIALGDNSPVVQLAAMEVLRTAGDKNWVMAAVNLACGVMPDALRDRASRLLKDGPPEALQMLAKILREGTPRLHAAKFGDGFDDNDYSELVGRLAAARALKFVGGEEAAAQLRAALRDDAWEMRATAAHLLGEIGDWASVPLLVKSSLDDDRDVAIESFIALGRLGGPVAKARLAEAAKDRDGLLARFAARALIVANAKKGEEIPAYLPERGAKDVVYLLDATFSLQMTYPGLKRWLKEKIGKERDNEDLRYGFILYRDHNNAFYTQEYYLSWDPKKVAHHIDQFKATGGDRSDGGGLDRALGVSMFMNWRDLNADRELGATREIRIVGDAEPYDDKLAEMRAKYLFTHARVTVNATCLNRHSEVKESFERISTAGGGAYDWIPERVMTSWGRVDEPPPRIGAGQK